MKYVRYSKYTGEPADEVDLDELVNRLSDFFLQSGYESQFYGISEMDPEKSMEQLRKAILQALEEGDLLPDDLIQKMLEQGAESDGVKQMLDRLIERLTEEGYINSQPQITAPPEKTPRGNVGAGHDAEANTRFEITDKTIDFLGFKALQQLLGSLGKSSFGRHDTRDLATGIESGGASRAYEFGDTLNLDVAATLFNAVQRDGAKIPIESTIPTSWSTSANIRALARPSSCSIARTA